MNKIAVKDLLIVSYPDAGAKLFAFASPEISNGNLVGIDLTDVDAVPTTFMNMSFGKLIAEFGKQRVKESLRFFNITKSQLERIKVYFDSFE